MSDKTRYGMVTPSDSAVALIDYQPAMFSGVHSHDRTTILQNVQIVAKAARLFKVPTILSTVAAESFSGSMIPEVTGIFPREKPIDRTSINAWLDGNFRKAVERTHRKKIIVAGLWTEACVLFPTLDMLKAGYEVVSPRNPDERSGIVTFRVPGADANALSNALLERNVVCAPRSGGVRVSPHFYNTTEEIGRLFEAIRAERPG